MPKLSNLNFDFLSRTYTAMVSLRQQGYDFHCTFRYIDKLLRYILQEDGFIFSLAEGLKKPKRITQRTGRKLSSAYYRGDY